MNKLAISSALAIVPRVFLQRYFRLERAGEFKTAVKYGKIVDLS